MIGGPHPRRRAPRSSSTVPAELSRNPRPGEAARRCRGGNRRQAEVPLTPHRIRSAVTRTRVLIRPLTERRIDHEPARYIRTWKVSPLGSWTAAEGAFSEVVEPATGSDPRSRRHRDCRRRRRGLHQTCRGAAPLGENAFRGSGRVLRRAGQLFEEHASEIETWIVREAGSIGESQPSQDACRSAGMLRGVGVAFASRKVRRSLSADGRLSFSRSDRGGCRRRDRSVTDFPRSS